jgi:FkbM family methyltransferase
MHPPPATKRLTSGLRKSLRRGSRRLIKRAGATRAVRSSPLGQHLTRLFQQLDVNVVIDVGGRQGEYGQWLRRNGYRGWIFSFEPVRQSFAILSQRAGADDLWVLHNCALGSEAGQAQINVTEGTAFSSFLTPSAYASATFGARPAIAGSEQVEIKTLDAVLRGLLDRVGTPRGIYLKLDTQGWDLEVLRGASASLDRIDALQSEIGAQSLYEGMPTMRESLVHLETIGFAVSGMFAVHLDQRLRIVDFDCVAVKGLPARS